jgi:hypothetical protein
MTQAWLQVTGLVVEFLGVLLLAWEWFTAQRQDAAERAIAAEHARREESMAGLQRMQQPSSHLQTHFEMSRDMQRRMTAGRIDHARQHYGGLRGRIVVLALLLVTAGFVLQLLGSWPGCCRAIGILPGG